MNLFKKKPCEECSKRKHNERFENLAIRFMQSQMTNPHVSTETAAAHSIMVAKKFLELLDKETK